MKDDPKSGFKSGLSPCQICVALNCKHTQLVMDNKWTLHQLTAEEMNKWIMKWHLFSKEVFMFDVVACEFLPSQNRNQRVLLTGGDI